jgi:hypothetical protein
MIKKRNKFCRYLAACVTLNVADSVVSTACREMVPWHSEAFRTVNKRTNPSPSCDDAVDRDLSAITFSRSAPDISAAHSTVCCTGVTHCLPRRRTARRTAAGLGLSQFKRLLESPTKRGAPKRLVVFQNFVRHFVYTSWRCSVCVVRSGLHIGWVSEFVFYWPNKCLKVAPDQTVGRYIEQVTGIQTAVMR